MVVGSLDGWCRQFLPSSLGLPDSGTLPISTKDLPDPANASDRVATARAERDRRSNDGTPHPLDAEGTGQDFVGSCKLPERGPATLITAGARDSLRYCPIVPSSVAEAAPQRRHQSEHEHGARDRYTFDRQVALDGRAEHRGTRQLFAPEAIFVHVGVTMSKTQSSTSLRAEPSSTRTRRSRRSRSAPLGERPSCSTRSGSSQWWAATKSSIRSASRRCT
jgi:hypothetical protein